MPVHLAGRNMLTGPLIALGIRQSYGPSRSLQSVVLLRRGSANGSGRPHQHFIYKDGFLEMDRAEISSEPFFLILNPVCP